MTERLQKIIASRGLCSRRQAEAMIEAGRVLVNGRTALLGESADEDRDEILVDGAPLPRLEKRVYLMLNKPRGYVTTLRDEKGRKNAAGLVAGCGERVYPVGRLDMDSEGLLLFTNDGEFANHLMHPSHEMSKRYYVWVKDYSPEGMRLLGRPIELDGYRIRPPKLKLLAHTRDGTLIEVTIHEGRNRQIRRMCDEAGMEVIRLKRVQEGDLKLGDLKKGQWRHLTQEEVCRLYK